MTTPNILCSLQECPACTPLSAIQKKRLLQDVLAYELSVL